MTEPLVRVVRGAPTDEELAALTVVLTSLLAARCDEPSRPAGEPATWQRGHGRYHSPGSWRGDAHGVSHAA